MRPTFNVYSKSGSLPKNNFGIFFRRGQWWDCLFIMRCGHLCADLGFTASWPYWGGRQLKEFIDFRMHTDCQVLNCTLMICLSTPATFKNSSTNLFFLSKQELIFLYYPSSFVSLQCIPSNLSLCIHTIAQINEIPGVQNTRIWWTTDLKRNLCSSITAHKLWLKMACCNDCWSVPSLVEEGRFSF